MGVKPVQVDFQHDFARMTDETDKSVGLCYMLCLHLLKDSLIVWIQ